MPEWLSYKQFTYLGDLVARPVLFLILVIVPASQYAQAVLPLTRDLQESPQNTSPDNIQRFSLAIQQIERPTVKKEEMLIQITVTNLTDKVLLIRTFRGREADGRVVLEQGSSRIMQRIHTSEGLAPLGREGAATIIQPHSSAQELIGLKRLYNLSSGSYSVYVVNRDPITKSLVKSNTLNVEVP